jgi:hypothetical protein
VLSIIFSDVKEGKKGDRITGFEGMDSHPATENSIKI